MSTDAVTPAPVLWAQRNDVIFLTLNVECKDPEIKITEDSLTFKATGSQDKRKYETTVNFLKKVNTENVVSKNCGRCYEFIFTKANTKEDYWKSLTNDSKKPHWLKVDFNKWKDEGSDDDSDKEGGMPGGMGMPGMGGMPGMEGMGGMGGMDFSSMLGGMGGGMDGKPSFDDLDGEEDSDDEEIPDLENASEKKAE